MIASVKSGYGDTMVRAISNDKIKEKIYNTDIAENDLPAGHFWVNVCHIDEVPMSGPHRAWVIELISKLD